MSALDYSELVSSLQGLRCVAVVNYEHIKNDDKGKEWFENDMGRVENQVFLKCIPGSSKIFKGSVS